MYLLTIILIVSGHKPKEYKVDLLNPPETRWTRIQAEYASLIKPFAESYASSISESELAYILSILEKGYLNPELSKELHALANTVDITYEQAVFLNFMYEYNAYCTSIVVKLMNGTVIHGRNLDYESSPFLSQTTVEIHVWKGTQYLYTSVGFAWYLGVGTGIGLGYSVSLNQRDAGGRAETYAALEKGYPGDLWVLRMSFTNIKDFNQADSYLNNTKVAASTYYIIAGYETGAIITRDRDAAANWLGLNQTSWYLVQTNTDNWLPDPDGRRTTAEKALEAIGRENMNVEKLLEVLQTYPVINPTTVFTSIMVPSTGYLNTTVY
jgi:hypothetical protein